MHVYFHPPQVVARNLISGGNRKTFPRFGMDVSPDFYVSIGLSAIMIPAVIVTLVLVTGTAFMYAALLVAALSVASLLSLWLTVLGDPGLVTELPLTVAPHDVVEVKALLQMPEMMDRDVCACRVCGVLVASFDHHCGVIGACIGERNMWSFVTFLLSTALLCAVGVTSHIALLYGALPQQPLGEWEQVRTMISMRFALSAACVLLCGYGGAYCAVLGAMYISYVTDGQDSWGKRWYRRADGKTKWRRLTESFSWARRWRSSYSVRETVVHSGVMLP